MQSRLYILLGQYANLRNKINFRLCSESLKGDLNECLNNPFVSIVHSCSSFGSGLIGKKANRQNSNLLQVLQEMEIRFNQSQFAFQDSN